MKICTYKLFLKLSWFIFKLAPSQFEEALKDVWSPEDSCCIFEQKRQFTQLRDRRVRRIQHDSVKICHVYSCGIILSTTDVLNFFI